VILASGVEVMAGSIVGVILVSGGVLVSVSVMPVLVPVSVVLSAEVGEMG